MTGNRAKPHLVLQSRDGHLLRELASMRVIDRDMATVVGSFGSTTRVNTRLLALVNGGYLQRMAVGTTRGGHKYVYALTRAGASAMGVTFRPIPWKRSTVVAGQPFLEHQLRLNQVYLALKYTTVPAGVAFQSWRTFHHTLDPRVRLIPDAYCELAVRGEAKAMFVEVDQGTESLRVWRAKVHEYLALATTGIFRQQFSHLQFRVLVIMPSMRRLNTISQCIATQTTKLFWLTTYLDDVKPVWDARWRRPGSPQSIHLI